MAETDASNNETCSVHVADATVRIDAPKIRLGVVGIELRNTVT